MVEAASVAAPARRIVYQAGFETIARAVNLDSQPELIAELSKLGYDRNREQTEYPYEVMQRVLERVRQHAFPLLSIDQGFEALGRQSFRAYRSTLVGQVVMAAMSMIPLERVVRLAARGFKSVSNYYENEVRRQGERQLIYSTLRSTIPGAYTKGLLLELLAGSHNENVRVRLESETPERTDFSLSW